MVRIGLVLLMSISCANVAFAKARLHLAGSYSSQEYTKEGTSSEDSTTIINLSLAGDISNNAFLGFKYYSHNHDDGFKIRASGIVAGYIDPGGFLLAASWMINPEKTFTESKTKTVHKSNVGLELNGIIIDVAYMLKAGSFRIGPQITYAQFDYDKVVVEDVTTDLDNTGDKFITPFVSLMYEM